MHLLISQHNISCGVAGRALSLYGTRKKPHEIISKAKDKNIFS